jgi:hypothetical protein
VQGVAKRNYVLYFDYQLFIFKNILNPFKNNKKNKPIYLKINKIMFELRISIPIGVYTQQE